jgi:N-acetylglutamate synthase-like GNAT family acetyltransferase
MTTKKPDFLEKSGFSQMDTLMMSEEISITYTQLGGNA